jgi:hypothetical protein
MNVLTIEDMARGLEALKTREPPRFAGPPVVFMTARDMRLCDEAAAKDDAEGAFLRSFGFGSARTDPAVARIFETAAKLAAIAAGPPPAPPPPTRTPRNRAERRAARQR